jgi:hypothetical protein
MQARCELGHTIGSFTRAEPQTPDEPVVLAGYIGTRCARLRSILAALGEDKGAPHLSRLNRMADACIKKHRRMQSSLCDNRWR